MIRGVGLHGGLRASVRLHRDDGETRFRLRGGDLPARLPYVVDSSRSTVLGAGERKVATVEHLLAALHARGFWNGVLIEVEGEELPILDGSAEPWLEAIDELGVPPPPPDPLVVRERFALTSSGTAGTLIEVAPGSPSMCVAISFAHPAIGAQRWCGSPERYDELLCARTFGFLDEWEGLKSKGLAIGAGLENAIVFSGEEPLQALRHPDEPVRHKALDALGDFFLLGRPLSGRLSVERGSHAAHVEFLRALAIRHHLKDTTR